MAMMASASSGNPYEDYDNTEIEQDLLDPDDGDTRSITASSSFVLIMFSKHQRSRRSATVELGPSSLDGEYSILEKPAPPKLPEFFNSWRRPTRPHKHNR